MAMQTPRERKILSVSQLNQRARQLLETHFAQVWVEGEISNLVRPSSGHWYFTLKDSKAQIRCAMFRNRNQALRFRVEDGMKLTARGRLGIYENRGDYQLVVEHLEQSGVGDLQRAFEELKLQLAERGWFAPERKRPLPSLPRHIGVITSPTGAAIRDILVVLRRRFPSIPVTVFPVPVQGQEAAAQIADAIECANRLGPELEPGIDVLIVGRGGGSLEDLWAFNEEATAAAIFNSALPVVSAVGHEIDFSIADLVADHRAATPSAAAETLSPDQQQWLNRIADYRARLSYLAAEHIADHRRELQVLQQRLKHPGTRLQEYSLRLDEAELRMQRAQSRLGAKRSSDLLQLHQQLVLLSPLKKIAALRQRLALLSRQLELQMHTQLERKRGSMEKSAEVLNSVSPLQTLQRGYAIVTDSQGEIVKSVTQLTAKQAIGVRLGDGAVDATVNAVPEK